MGAARHFESDPTPLNREVSQISSKDRDCHLPVSHVLRLLCSSAVTTEISVLRFISSMKEKKGEKNPANNKDLVLAHKHLQTQTQFIKIHEGEVILILVGGSRISTS